MQEGGDLESEWRYCICGLLNNLQAASQGASADHEKVSIQDQEKIVLEGKNMKLQGNQNSDGIRGLRTTPEGLLDDYGEPSNPGMEMIVLEGFLEEEGTGIPRKTLTPMCPL